MFRRRPFRPRAPLRRRPFRRGPLLPPLPPRAREALARANRLMDRGQFLEAAGIFGRLSEEAEQRGMPVRAADLILLASRACFAAGDIEAALAQARQGLHMLIRADRVGRVPLLLSKVTAALREKGYNAQADQLEQEITQALEEAGLSLDEARQHASQVPEKRGSLPAKCDGCGAPLVPDEVEWHDAYTAECPYCGTIAKAS
jgi:hypothetical protein